MFYQYQEEITTEDGVTLIPPVTVSRAEPAVPVKGYGAPNDGVLPATGFDITLLSIACLMVLAGMLLLALRKKKTESLK